MGFLHVVFLAIIQGITEFLPVSSSAHLILVTSYSGSSEGSLTLDVAIHLGSLIAVILFFKSDIRTLLNGLWQNICFKVKEENAVFFRSLVISTFPIVFIGLFLKLSNLILVLRSTQLIAWGMIIFGLLLLIADKIGKNDKIEIKWSAKDAFYMGLWQSLALLPGSSRSGTTITGGRLLGYDRLASTRLSMMMSIPTILASAILLSLDIGNINYNSVGLDLLCLAILLSFLAAFITLSLLVKFIQYFSFTPFVIYRCLLGCFLLYFIYS